MDFGPALAGDYVRRGASWATNDLIAGYCAPERATGAMWRKLQAARERERERERDRVRRAVSARGGVTGRSSPRPGRRRSSNGGVHGGRRRAFDSETYALFGDDNLVDLPDADVRPEEDSLGAVGLRADRRTERPRPDRRSADAAPLEQDVSKSGDVARPDKRLPKADVWSVGWLLYYMSTGRHPPRDAWARRSAVDLKELCAVPTELREIIQMCVQRDVSKRACMRDVKRQLDRILQGLMFAKGLALLGSEPDAGFVLLDKAVGIRSPARATPPGSMTTDRAGSEPASAHATLGLNQKTRLALACLPLAVVRRVEWEAAGRYLKRTEDELGALRRALVNERWAKGDVRNGEAAVGYLERRAEEGVGAAQSALGWVLRWGAGGAGKDVGGAVRLWERAVQLGDAEALNGLGLAFHHGVEGISVDGGRAQGYYERAVEMGYVLSLIHI